MADFIQQMSVLGWYGSDGRSYLSTWDGPPTVDVLFLGLPAGMDPMTAAHQVTRTADPSSLTGWKVSPAPLPEGVTIERMPEGLPEGREGFAEKLAYANSRGGVWAFGWIDDETAGR